jgi:hypothetical protein
MNKKNVLVVSNQQDENSLSSWAGIEHPFHVSHVSTDEAAIELFQRELYDMVVVDGTDESIDARKLQAVLPILQEDVTLLPYKGETVTQLQDNVEAVFNAKRYQRIKRMLMLEPSVPNPLTIPPFSLN